MASESQQYMGIDVEELRRKVVARVQQEQVFRLTEIGRFLGAGIYLIYYTGETRGYPAYGALADHHHEHPFDRPIYAGKAVPGGSRKGGAQSSDRSTSLYDRLTGPGDHLGSIASVSGLGKRPRRRIPLFEPHELARGTLHPSDFYCRYHVVPPAYDFLISAFERLLINHLMPVWNVVVDGFGNHDPGEGRRVQVRSMWDTIHPGRSWVDRHVNPNQLSADEINERIMRYLAGQSVPLLPLEDQLSEADSDNGP